MAATLLPLDTGLVVVLALWGVLVMTLLAAMALSDLRGARAPKGHSRRPRPSLLRSPSASRQLVGPDPHRLPRRRHFDGRPPAHLTWDRERPRHLRVVPKAASAYAVERSRQ
jgi:hypothetical protein